tara:strand:+ start:66383 stop:66772 length:390 start_codon:yes stop_codon:yes gene_type:complete
MKRLCAIFLLVAAPVAAQTILTPDEFLDRAEGRTLTFESFPGGGLVGVEQFLSRSRTRWVHADGHCTTGQMEKRPPFLCFIYSDDPSREHCWVPYDHPEGLLVRSPEGDTQRVTEISDIPLVCGDPPMS